VRIKSKSSPIRVSHSVTRRTAGETILASVVTLIKSSPMEGSSSGPFVSEKERLWQLPLIPKELLLDSCQQNNHLEIQDEQKHDRQRIRYGHRFPPLVMSFVFYFTQSRALPPGSGHPGTRQRKEVSGPGGHVK
jgi:hypothetical protein